MASYKIHLTISGRLTMFNVLNSCHCLGPVQISGQHYGWNVIGTWGCPHVKWWKVEEKGMDRRSPTMLYIYMCIHIIHIYIYTCLHTYISYAYIYIWWHWSYGRCRFYCNSLPPGRCNASNSVHPEEAAISITVQLRWCGIPRFPGWFPDFLCRFPEFIWIPRKT